jgi:CheY-like chemotaxis protein
MRPCILSADDEKEVLDCHRKIMKQYGFEVHRTTRLDRIKGALEKTDIDCIHLDILFDQDLKEPDWDRPNGLSTMGEIARRGGEIPIMVISGYIDEKAKKMAKKYGLTNLIYKWYPKPADYGMIALDTIKAINEFKLEKTKNHVIKYINTTDEERKEKAAAALNFIPILPGFIELKPNYLLDKLEDLSYKILGCFEPLDILHFREIVKEHAYEYFKDVSLNHSNLAEHLVGAISEVDEKNLGTEPAFKLILAIVEKLRQEILSEDEVYEVRVKLEDILNVRIGFRMKSSEDVDRYLELIETDDDDEEK